jgi:hypothetical protein
MPEQSTSPITHRPILIVGPNGSGTTLLRLMLDSHEHIAIPAETGFLRLAAAHEWVPYWELGDRWAKGLGLSDADLTRTLAEFYGGLFASYAETRGKQRWGDKTPFHVWHLALAARMFPDLQVVGIVRHPAAVVTSLRRRFRRPLPRSIRHWKRWTRQLMHQAANLGDRCVVLRYEDLVADPEATMRPLLDWLGEPWSARVLAHHENHAGLRAEVEGFTRADVPLNTSHVAEWENHLRGRALQHVVVRTHDLSVFLGYDPAHGVPATRWGADRPFLTGTEISARRRTHGSAIDWQRLPKPPYADRPMRPSALRRRPGAKTLDNVTIREVVTHRALARLRRRVSDDTRKRAHELRRSKPGLDRFIGPR